MICVTIVFCLYACIYFSARLEDYIGVMEDMNHIGGSEFGILPPPIQRHLRPPSQLQPYNHYIYDNKNAHGQGYDSVN